MSWSITVDFAQLRLPPKHNEFSTSQGQPATPVQLHWSDLFDSHCWMMASAGQVHAFQRSIRFSTCSLALCFQHLEHVHLHRFGRPLEPCEGTTQTHHSFISNNGTGNTIKQLQEVWHQNEVASRRLRYVSSIMPFCQNHTSAPNVYRAHRDVQIGKLCFGLKDHTF